MRISDWSSDVCSSDLLTLGHEVESGNAGKEFHGQTRPVRRLQNGAARTCDSPGWRFKSESAGPTDTIAARSLGGNGENGRRAAERRVGNECVSTGRIRRWPDAYKKKSSLHELIHVLFI